MYSGTTFTRMSGRLLGVHQKIDRVAREHLAAKLSELPDFPSIRAILHFEGVNGPDAIKRKSPAHDEPWHFYSPFNAADDRLLKAIALHERALTDALVGDDLVKAAFEAAWLAHAIVDGLTPAHHYPYEEILAELRGGEGIETRSSIGKKLIMPGATRRQSLANNWKMWGPKGLMSTHSAFEMGVATIMKPMSLKKAVPTAEDFSLVRMLGVVEYFKRAAKEIAAMSLYDKFYKSGWTTPLARKVRRELAPTLVKTVTLAWYQTAYQAEQAKS